MWNTGLSPLRMYLNFPNSTTQWLSLSSLLYRGGPWGGGHALGTSVVEEIINEVNGLKIDLGQPRSTQHRVRVAFCVIPGAHVSS